MQSSLAIKPKRTRDYSRGKRPWQQGLDKYDCGLTGTDYRTRLDDDFNKEYLILCHLERQRFFSATRAANS
jgi:hypothetical protein